MTSYRLLPEDEQKRLIDNLVGNMDGVDDTIQARQIEHFYKADPEYGRDVADGLGLAIDDIIDDALLAVEDQIADADVVADFVD